MNLKSYLKIMSGLTFLCWLSWGFILFTVNPGTTNWLGFLLFYATLFLAVAGSAAVIGFLFRFVGLKQELIFHSVKEAFRQSFLLAALVVAILLLLSQNLFTWFNIILLVISLSLLEFFLISYSARKYK